MTIELSACNKLDPKALHVWIIDGGEHRRHDSAVLEHLQADEAVRARRFKREAHAARWAFFRAVTRHILGAYTNQAPLEIGFHLGEHGKPALRHLHTPPVFFNLSHAGTLALLAVTRRAPVGVDLEPVRELNDREALVRRFFSTAEQSAFARTADAQRDTTFFNIWTRKEALIKANGSGLSAPLDAFDVPINRITGWHPTAVRPPLPANTCFPVSHIDPDPGYVGAVALELADTQCDDLPTLELYRFAPGKDRFTRRTNP